MRILVIANPRAGKGSTERKVDQLTHYLRLRGHHVEVFLSSGPADPARRATTVRDGDFDTIVVGGGDGTVNAVINGLSDPSRIPILHLATGTANILAKDLGLPVEPELLVPVIEDGVIVRADMGLLEDHRFLLVASAGFDAMVTERLTAARGKTLGYRGYLLPILRSVGQYRPPSLEVEIDGKHRVTGAMVMVLNSRHYGGIFVFDDAARLDSGSFQVCVFPRGSVPALVRYALSGLLRLASGLPEVMRYSGGRVTISCAENCPVEVDGEYAGTTPVEIKLSPATVPLLAPQQ
jgi:diacylglycerol kinase (ATP)